jgi:plasmid stabilization system protein ParE
LVEYSPTARQHIIGLRQHYSRLQRPEAIRNLQNSLQDAERRIEQAPHLGLPTPRPYPRLIVEGVRWIKTGPYWVAYTFTTDKILVAGVFHESADIPNRM